MKTLSTNRLASSPHYEKILIKYNQVLENDGKVNNLKFYREVILPLIPNYHLQSWYQFLRRFKASAGLVVATASNQNNDKSTLKEENKLQNTILSNEKATSTAINIALNIGLNHLKQLLEEPQSLSVKDSINLIFKAMKAQDSRVHAIGKIREDTRKEDAFERAFAQNAYGD